METLWKDAVSSVSYDVHQCICCDGRSEQHLLVFGGFAC